MFKKTSVLVATLTLFLSACGSSDPANQKFDPGVQFNAETLMLTPGSTITDVAVNWYADTASGNSAVVNIFDEKDNLVSSTKGNTVAASTGKTAHKVIVSGLKLGTNYRYRVSNDEKNWSYEYNYTTGNATSFRFASVGDPQLTTGLQDASSREFSSDQTTAQGWKDTMKKIAAANVNFIAGVGDQVDTAVGGNEAEYQNFLAPPELRSIPLAPAVGNHDVHKLFLYHYNLPNEQTFVPIGDGDQAMVEAAGHYWYLYDNALFVVLNTSAYPASVAEAKPYIARFEATLKAATEANKGKYTWLFVQHHKSTASVAQHLADKDIQYYVQAGFENLMASYKVDFVLAGHDHVYARSFVMSGELPIDQPVDREDQSVYNSPNGTLYLTFNTGSGLKYYNIFDPVGLYEKNNVDYPFLFDGTKGSVEYLKGKLPLSTHKNAQEKEPEYTIVDVAGNTVKFKVSGTYTGNVVDEFTVTK